MMRIPLNFIVLLVVVLCAFSVINANHQSRKLFVSLEAERKHARDLAVEWDQLQLEQSTWAASARVEKLAKDKLGMRRPAPGEVMSGDIQINQQTMVEQKAGTKPESAVIGKAAATEQVKQVKPGKPVEEAGAAE